MFGSMQNLQGILQWDLCSFRGWDPRAHRNAQKCCRLGQQRMGQHIPARLSCAVPPLSIHPPIPEMCHRLPPSFCRCAEFTELESPSSVSWAGKGEEAWLWHVWSGFGYKCVHRRTFFGAFPTTPLFLWQRAARGFFLSCSCKWGQRVQAFISPWELSMLCDPVAPSGNH